MAFGAGTRQWVRGTLANIAASTVVLGQGEILVGDDGSLRGGDGAAQIKSLSPALTVAVGDGRYRRVNNVLTFGAAEDGGTTNNLSAINAAITAAVANGNPVFLPWVTGQGYGVTGRINWPDNIDMIGQGFSLASPGSGRLNGARLKLGDAASGVNIGNTLTGGNNTVSAAFYGSLSARLIIDGNNVATQPLLIGRRTQSTIGPITVINAAALPAYNAGTTYAVGAKIAYQGFAFKNLTGSTGTAPVLTGTPAAPTTSATWALIADNSAVVIQEAQNNTFDDLWVQDCAGTGIVFDGGCGANIFRCAEVTNCGANSYAVIFQQSYNSGAGSADPVYSVPARNLFNGGNIERIPSTSLGFIAHAAGSDNTFSNVSISGTLKTAAYSMVQMSYDGTHTSTRLRFRDCYWFGETTAATVFEVANGCELVHSGDVGLLGQYVYWLHTGCLVDASAPYADWTGVTTLLNPSSVAVDGVAMERRNVGIRALSGTSRASALLWDITSLGTMTMQNVKVASADFAGGSQGILSLANTTHMPTGNPSVSCAMGSVNGALIAHTSNGSIVNVAGNWQTKSASYTMIAGDSGVLATASAASVTITLPPATSAVNSGNQVGSGCEVVIRRTDNSANTLTVAAQGTDTVNLLGTLSGVASTTIASLQALRLVSDGNGHWVQM